MPRHRYPSGPRRRMSFRGSSHLGWFFRLRKRARMHRRMKDSKHQDIDRGKKMKTRTFVRAAVLSTLAIGVSSFGCNAEKSNKVKDPCENQQSSCGDPLLQFAIWEPLPDGEYLITIESSEGDGTCTLVRNGDTDTGLPALAFECEEGVVGQHADFDRYGLLFWDWMPETITVAIENVATGCSVSQTESPTYKATWSECGTTCIDALIEMETNELRGGSCSPGAGGSGGAGGRGF